MQNIPHARQQQHHLLQAPVAAGRAEVVQLADQRLDGVVTFLYTQLTTHPLHGQRHLLQALVAAGGAELVQRVVAVPAQLLQHLRQRRRLAKVGSTADKKEQFRIACLLSDARRYTVHISAIAAQLLPHLRRRCRLAKVGPAAVKCGARSRLHMARLW